MPRTQTGRLVAVSTPLGDDVLLLRRFSGTEHLGRMFAFNLDMLSEDRHVPFESLVGQNITVRLELLDGETRFFNGYVSRLVQSGAASTLVPYQATVVPWLWFLTRVADCRIFQNMTAPDIIKDVFRARGFSDFDDSGLSGSYEEWENCVQYRETDFNFISRLMEQEGIYYYFKHEDGKHTLMLADSPSAHAILPGYPSLPFRPPSKARFDEETVSEWTLEKEIQPGVVALNDFDFINPKNPLEAKAAISRNHAVPDLEVFDYPGEYVSAADGENYARLRIEELQAGYEVATGVTDARGLAPGFRLTLADHPRDDQNREYLITSATYDIESDDFESGGGGGSGGNGNGKAKSNGDAKGDDEKRDYDCTFTAIDAVNPFRAQRITPKPSIAGPQTAIVVGKAGEEIWTDEHGRVKVQFHWDRYSQADEESSCWIRVAQSWAGKKWGAIFLPRIGQEVIVEFLEGDPDCPIITGRVYNGDNKTPYDLPANATMSTMKSLSSKGGAGFNEIRFEDKKGEEHLFVHGEKDLHLRVKNDRLEWIGNDRHLIVKHDRLEFVENNRHEKVGNNHYEEIVKDRHLRIKGDDLVQVDGKQSLKITGDVTTVFGGARSEDLTGDHYTKAAKVVIEASGGITLKCGSNAIVIDSSGITIKGSAVTIDASSVKIASGPGASAGSGSAGSLAAPEAPEEALEAITAEPGQTSEAQAKGHQVSQISPGSRTSTAMSRSSAEELNEEETSSWISIGLEDEAGVPAAGEPYRLKLPDGRIVSGNLDGEGKAVIRSIPPGQCQISYPEIDGGEWKPA